MQTHQIHFRDSLWWLVSAVHYLGARAVIEALGHHFYDLLENKPHPYVIYAGHQLSEDYHAELLEILDRKDYSLG